MKENLLLLKDNDSYHSLIKTKPVDENPNAYIDSSKEINKKNPEFKIGDIIKTSR